MTHFCLIRGPGDSEDEDDEVIGDVEMKETCDSDVAGDWVRGKIRGADVKSNSAGVSEDSDEVPHGGSRGSSEAIHLNSGYSDDVENRDSGEPSEEPEDIIDVVLNRESEDVKVK